MNGRISSPLGRARSLPAPMIESALLQLASIAKRLQAELEDLLGVSVDLVTPADLPADIRRQVLAEALPV